MVDEMPRTCDEAYFLFESGEISEALYSQFVSVLLVPICLSDGEIERLVPIDVNGLLPSREDVKKAIVTGNSNKDALETLFPSLELFSRYIDWSCLHTKSRSIIRSGVVVDSGTTKANVRSVISFSDSYTIKSNIDIHENSVALDERSINCRWDALSIELGSIRPKVADYFVTPMYTASIPDSLTLLFGDGKRLNGGGVSFDRSRIDAYGGLSMLQSEKTAVGELGIHLGDCSRLSLLGYSAQSESASTTIGGISYFHNAHAITMVSLWDIKKDAFHCAFRLYNRSGGWKKSLQSSYTSGLSSFKGFSFSSKLPQKAKLSVLYTSLHTGFYRRGTSYGATTNIVQSKDYFKGDLYMKYAKVNTVSQTYSARLSGVKETFTPLVKKVKIASELTISFFRDKVDLGWHNSLSVQNRNFSKNRITITSKWSDNVLEAETSFAHTLYAARKPKNQFLLTFRKKNGTLGYYGITAIVTVADPEKSIVKFFSTLKF